MDVARSFSSITFLSKVVGVKYVDSAQATGAEVNLLGTNGDFRERVGRLDE